MRERLANELGIGGPLTIEGSERFREGADDALDTREDAGHNLLGRIYSDPGRVHGGETARGGIHGVPLKSWTRTSRPFTPCLRAVCR